MNTILFVCVENTFRSVLSEELFNAKAPRGWRAESAGVSPATEVNPNVRPLLKEVGITLTERTPRVATRGMIDRASRVVTFGCVDRCPIGAKQKSEDWPLPGATGKSFAGLREIRDELSRRIDDLIVGYCTPALAVSRQEAGRVLPRSKLAAMREELLLAARSRSTVTYGDLMHRHGLSRGRPLTAAIGKIDRLEVERGAPGFAAIIVRKDTGYPGGGYFCYDDLPANLRNPKEKSTDPRLSSAQKGYILKRREEIWDHYGKRRG